MADDVLRMRATIAPDQALADLRKIGRGLAQVGSEGGRGFKQANTEAMKFAATLKTIGAETAGTLIPAIMQLGSRAGVWGTVAAGAVAAGVAIKKASTALVEMSANARTMGITVGQFRAMEAAAEKAGIKTDVFASSMRTFGDNMTQLKYRTGSFYDEMIKLGKIDLVEKLRAASGDLAKQGDILKEHAKLIEQQRGPGEAAIFMEKSGLDRSLIAMESMSKAAQEQSKAYDDLLPKAQAVHRAYIEARDAAERTAVHAADTATSWEKIIGLMGRIPTPGVPFLPVPGVSGARAGGGPVNRGMSYLVGEHGPELFSPGTSGGIFAPGGSGSGGDDRASRMVQRGVFDALVQFQSYIRTGGGEGGMMTAGFGGSAGAAAGGGVGKWGGGGYTGSATSGGNGTGISSSDTGGGGGPRGASLPGNKGGTTDRAQIVMDELIKGGMSPAQAAAVAGHSVYESDVGRNQNKGEGAAGLVHWRQGRRANMEKYLASQGVKSGDLTSEDSLRAQARFFNQERQGAEAKGSAGFNAYKGDDPREAARLLKPNIRYGTNTTEDRAAIANQQLNEYTRRKNGGAPDGQQQGANVGADGKATGNRVLPGRSLAGTDPRITEIMTAAAEGLPEGYKIRPTSGRRTAGQGQHTHGHAQDWEIVGPDGVVRNRGEDTTGLYTRLARNAYGYQEKNHPDLTGEFHWGGQFGTSKKNPWEPDLMHFGFGRRRGRISKYSRESIGAVYPPTSRVDSAVASNSTPPQAKGSVAVTINSNGTAASAQSKTDGDLFQNSTVTHNKTGQPTEAQQTTATGP